MIRFEIIYDPNDKAVPLKLNCPSGVNPMFIAGLLSQAVTALIMSNVPGGDSLILPAAKMPKLQ